MWHGILVPTMYIELKYVKWKARTLKHNEFHCKVFCLIFLNDPSDVIVNTAVLNVYALSTATYCNTACT